MEFSHLENYIFFIIPLFILIIVIVGYKKRDRIIKSLNFNIEYRFKILKSFLITLGIILITFSLLGPQALKGYKEVKKKGLDIYVLIDVSKSMLAEDIKPNRLARTKKSIQNLIDSLHGDRIGFIPFSSDAYVQMPLTDDYQLAKMFLEVIDTDMIAGGGTNIASAIKLAQHSFTESSVGDKVIVIFSDGEEHNQQGMKAVQEIKNIKIYTIGMGSKSGALIPEYNSQGEKIGYKRDKDSKFINSKLNTTTLQEIAREGEGRFYLSTVTGDEIVKLINDIFNLSRGRIKKDKVKKFTKLYQYFLGSGLILFLLGYFLEERRGLE